MFYNSERIKQNYKSKDVLVNVKHKREITVPYQYALHYLSRIGKLRYSPPECVLLICDANRKI
jgi:hypothetical protein